MEKRQQAISWWNNIGSAKQQVLKEFYCKDRPAFLSNTPLTGREIQEIWEKDYLSRMESKDAFGYFPEAAQGKVQGLLSHTNVITERGGKFDVYPHPKLIEMLKNL